MRWLKNIVVLLTAVIWLPASSHALLEYAGLIHERHADHDADSGGSQDDDADSHEAADGKCALSSTHASVPMPNAVASPFPVCAVGLERAAVFHAELPASGLAPPGTAPPQLSQHWQFSFRTALPARAPSLIS